MSSCVALLDAEHIAATWRDHGFTCEEWSDVPGHEWPDRIHETDELLVLLEGELEIELDGETLRPEVGEEILLPAFRPYTLRSVGVAPTRWLLGSWADFAHTD